MPNLPLSSSSFPFSSSSFALSFFWPSVVVGRPSLQYSRNKEEERERKRRKKNMRGVSVQEKMGALKLTVRGVDRRQWPVWRKNSDSCSNLFGASQTQTLVQWLFLECTFFYLSGHLDWTEDNSSKFYRYANN